MKKALTILFGPFTYKRTPAAEIDGGMAEYVFQQFQQFPPQNVVAGRGFIFRNDLMVTEPDLFVFAPVGAPIDVTKLPLDGLSADQPLIEENLDQDLYV